VAVTRRGCRSAFVYSYLTDYVRCCMFAVVARLRALACGGKSLDERRVSVWSMVDCVAVLKVNF
jgi:hypothetical protein